MESLQCKGQIKKVTRVEFFPKTGRTHQLRLAASCPAEKGGLGLPIVGDSLYGNKEKGESGADGAGLFRLMLHAAEITFFHPVSGETMHIVCPPDF